MTALIDTIPARLPAAGRLAWDKARYLPLILIFTGQALLSVRLLKSAPIISGDEGRYIYAGHQLIYELWHGGGSPYYETYFSGAPVIYPVLAAMVDHVCGLVGVRLMSLVFMLTATTCAYATSRRLFGYWAGIIAAGLFAGFAFTQDLGMYGTYDAMSLTLTAVAAYCAVRTSDEERHANRWLLAVPLVLLAANATKYVTVAFDFPVIAIAAYQARQCGWRRVLVRVGALAVATAGLVLLAAFLAGGAYVQGIMYSTLNRNSAYQAFLGGAKLQPAHVILAEAARWVGPVIAAAIVAVVAASAKRDWWRTALMLVLLLAGIIVTVEALKLHSDQSMRKHDDFGIWFACVAVSSLPAAFSGSAAARWRNWLTVLLAGAAVCVAALYYAYYAPLANSTYEAHPAPSILAAAGPLKPYLEHPGRFLLGGLTDDALLYTDHLGIPWWRHFDDQYIKYPIPGRGGDSHGQIRGRACFALRAGCMYLEGQAGYRAAIRAHWFTLISLIGDHGTTAQDVTIAQTTEHTPGYVLLTRIGGAPTWIYAPAYKHA